MTYYVDELQRPDTDRTVYRSMDYYVGSKLMQQFGFVQNNDKMDTPKSFYVSCGYFVFNISEEDAKLISGNEWCKIQLIIVNLKEVVVVRS